MHQCQEMLKEGACIFEVYEYHIKAGIICESDRDEMFSQDGNSGCLRDEFRVHYERKYGELILEKTGRKDTQIYIHSDRKRSVTNLFTNAKPLIASTI